MPCRIYLIGMGRMGRMIRDCAADRGIEVAAEFNTATIAQLAQCDRMDAVIDFSAPASLPALAAYVDPCYFRFLSSYSLLHNARSV